MIEPDKTSALASLAPYIALLLFAGLLILLECGRRVGRARTALEGEAARAGLGALEGSLFGLTGLLIAFSFSGAASRFESRRQLVVVEANDVGTAWLRVDLLPPEEQPALRKLFREYVDLRLESYRQIRFSQSRAAELHQEAQSKQAEIWKHAVRASATTPPPAAQLLLPALNAMFDTSTTRVAAMKQHPPTVIFGMLLALTLIGALLAGHAMSAGGGRSWVHILGHAVMLSLTVYVILDLEFPRLGFIRADAADEVLLNVRQSMDLEVKQ